VVVIRRQTSHSRHRPTAPSAFSKRTKQTLLHKTRRSYQGCRDFQETLSVPTKELARAESHVEPSDAKSIRQRSSEMMYRHSEERTMPLTPGSDLRGCSGSTTGFSISPYPRPTWCWTLIALVSICLNRAPALVGVKVRCVRCRGSRIAWVGG
jgi:hypothetical protein